MRVVLDTNSLLVSIGRLSRYRPIFDAFLQGEIKFLVSNDTLTEYQEILERKANAAVAPNITALLLRSHEVEQIDIHFKWSLIDQDADDNRLRP